MQLSSIFIGVVTTLVATSTGVFASPVPHEKRDVNAILDSIQNLQDKLVTLNTTVTGYDGGLAGLLTALKIQSQSGDVKKALEDAVDTTNESPNFTDEESQTVATTMVEFQPVVTSTLDSIVKKQPVFEEGVLGIISLAGLVKKNLEDQHELSTELGEAITQRLTPEFQDLAPIVTGAIDDAFNQAIEAYS